MGLLSGIKKLGKKIFKGVKKVFKGVGKFVGKVVGSKIGRIVLVAASVVTGGLALAAGIGAFTGQAAGATFLTKFVAGAKAFTGALMNPIGAGKGALQGMAGGGGVSGFAQGAAQGQGIFNVGMASGVTPPTPNTAVAPGAEATAVNASSAGLDQQVAEHLAKVGGGAPGAPTAAAAQSVATKGPGFWGRVNDFAQGPGGQMVGGLLKGAAQAYGERQEREDWQSHQRRYDRAWSDPRQQAILEEASRYRPRTPGGFQDRIQQTTGEMRARARRIPLGPAYGG